MTPQRYDLKEWWSKVTKKPYEKFIPWSGIATDTTAGLDPKLNDQVIFQMFNVDRYVFMRPNVENQFELSLKFINSNRCERLEIIEAKYEKYHNDLSLSLYENGAIYSDNGIIDSRSLYYTKETCETEVRRHEWSDIVVLTRSDPPDFRTILVACKNKITIVPPI